MTPKERLPTWENFEETFNRMLIEKINTEKYEAVPILEYLQSLNRGKHE